jgi:hypothetical protein
MNHSQSSELLGFASAHGEGCGRQSHGRWRSCWLGGAICLRVLGWHLTPDNQYVIFNSIVTGVAQVYAAPVPPGFLEGLSVVNPGETTHAH